MKLLALPVLNDNYIWLLHDGHHAIVVDPAVEVPVLEALDQAGLELRAILVTHHHPDHVGGVSALRERTGCMVYAPEDERIPKPYERVIEHQTLVLLEHKIEVMFVPGHTKTHVAYFVENQVSDPVLHAPILFCGDTLFSGGCGRLFEGTPDQMYDSLNAFKSLPHNTLVCCAHEYTLSNLKFALHVNPGNRDLLEYNAQCEKLRAQHHSTLPSSIGVELKINPFLRLDDPEVIESIQHRVPQAQTPQTLLGALREWKNTF
jgi:hydroxyacylglutathione hydrolase